jgi:hypothetical protein
MLIARAHVARELDEIEIRQERARLAGLVSIVAP